tara:strand:+ start:336 stop:1187 length:852 start_codon:yes stop_codon:yes gene_type:complete
MALSKFFSHSKHIQNTNEHYLVQSMVDESIKNFGIDVQYLPRTQNNIDTILNDAETSSFNTAYTIEAYLGTLEGFGGQDQIGQFGFEVRDTADFIISKNRFEEIVTTANSSILRPREGDIIFLPFTKQLFELTYVEDEQPFFQLGKTYVYQTSTALFRYEDEDFDTGVADVDVIETNLAQRTVLTLQAGGTNLFVAGETVTQGTITAEVLTIVGTALTVIDRSGDFAVSSTVPITGPTNNASWFITAVDTDTMANDLISDNLEFETEGASVIDFTESNPFGEF